MTGLRAFHHDFVEGELTGDGTGHRNLQCQSINYVIVSECVLDIVDQLAGGNVQQESESPQIDRQYSRSVLVGQSG